MTPERLEEIRIESYNLDEYSRRNDLILELLEEVDRLRALEALAPYTKQLPPVEFTGETPVEMKLGTLWNPARHLAEATVRLRDYIVEQRNAADSVARDPSLGHIGIAFVTANVYTGILTKGIDFGVFPLEPEESEVPS
jgi:hypothetical protein